MARLRPPFKIHGGKFYLSKWIISNFPSGYTSMKYVEPFVGAGSVLINKLPSKEEIICDSNKGICNIWNSLVEKPEKFLEMLKHVPYEESTFAMAQDVVDSKSKLINGVNEFILRRMSRGGLKKAFAWSDRKRGGKPGDVNAWETAINDVLPKIIERVKNVKVIHGNAMEVIQGYDSDNTLYYLDPPYLQETRTSKKIYEEDEMDDKKHEELGKLINSCKGRVIISGYPSNLYSDLFKDWKMIKIEVANHASQQKSKKKKLECIWMNF